MRLSNTATAASKQQTHFVLLIRLLQPNQPMRHDLVMPLRCWCGWSHARFRKVPPLSSQHIANPNREFSQEKIDNIAELIVGGESAIPWELPPQILESVLDGVHSKRRAQLIAYFARAIAEHIQTEIDSEREF